jgi:DNA-binding transcriptional ArsR family regulator
MAQAEQSHSVESRAEGRGEVGIDRWLTLLADSDRRAIVDHLAIHARGEDVTIGELAFAVGVTRFSMSRHLQLMREAGLVGLRKSGNRVLVRLTPEPMRIVDDWLWSVIEAVDARPAS